MSSKPTTEQSSGTRFPALDKARIAAQRIPKRQKLQLAISESARGTDGESQLLAGKIVITNPGGDHRQAAEGNSGKTRVDARG